jgi:hypothetical protein
VVESKHPLARATPRIRPPRCGGHGPQGPRGRAIGLSQDGGLERASSTPLSPRQGQRTAECSGANSAGLRCRRSGSGAWG